MTFHIQPCQPHEAQAFMPERMSQIILGQVSFYLLHQKLESGITISRHVELLFMGTHFIIGTRISSKIIM